MRTTLVAMAAAALVASVLGSAEHCDPGYECKYHYQTSTKLWYWDFSPLCNSGEYVHKEPNPTLNSSYHFNICGYSKQTCRPTEWVPPYQQGVAVQTWGDSPACPPQDCVDPATGNPTCCTQDCEVLGTGAPAFVINSRSNPQTGGINITHQGVPASDYDPDECPYDSKTGGFKPRSVVYAFQCDKKGKTGHLKVSQVYEGPQCQYNVVIKSVHGCASTYSGPDSYQSAGGAIAGSFFGGMAASVAIGGAAYWYFFIYRKTGYTGFGSGGSSGASASFGGTSSSAYNPVGA